MSEALLVRLPYRPLRHLLPSAGIGRFPEATYDMVRLGLGLYGVDPGGTLPLEPISRWVTTVSQVKALPPGATVGYGRAGRLPKGGRIAVLAIGYADGFRRSLSQGVGGAYLHGQWAPVIGNVCMDATMVEVSHIEGVQVGDEAVLFDEHFPVEMFAQRMGVIPYEVFTSVGRRVRRVYYSD
jgi:alanine racemase